MQFHCEFWADTRNFAQRGDAGGSHLFDGAEMIEEGGAPHGAEPREVFEDGLADFP